VTLIRVADFAPSPGGRFIADGPQSGEFFRESVLVPGLREAIRREEEIIVELDGVPGYGSSFLEEAFGGLVRLQLFSKSELGRWLRIRAVRSLYRPYKLLAERYISQAKPQTVAA
jgi:STAS-like domain of unknown function (DUF4325)